jgi:hypothetical protein
MTWIKKNTVKNEETFSWKAVIILLLLFALFIGAQLYFVLEYLING